MQLIADENVPQKIISRLTELGYKVLDLKTTHPRLPDPQIAKQAAESNFILITLDKDFLSLSSNYPSLRLILVQLSRVKKTETPAVADFLHQNNHLRKPTKTLIVKLENKIISIHGS